MNKAKLFKILKVVSSLLISLLVIYFLYNSFKEKSVSINFDYIKISLESNIYLFVLALLLTPLNWFLESFKWNFLISNFRKLNNWDAFKIVLSSLSVGLITPNRAGDFIGRISIFKKEERSLAIYSTFLNSLAQLSITIFLGVIFLAEFVYLIPNEYALFRFNKWIFFSLSIIVLFIYLKSNTISLLFNRILDKQNDTVNYNVINTYPNRLIVLTFSFIRYVVFTIQFTLICVGLGEPIGFTLIGAIVITFFVSTVIPTTWLSDLAVRLGVSYFIFSLFGMDPLAGLTSSFILWIFNIFLPAMVGLVFLNQLGLGFYKKFSL